MILWAHLHREGSRVWRFIFSSFTTARPVPLLQVLSCVIRVCFVKNISFPPLTTCELLLLRCSTALFVNPFHFLANSPRKSRFLSSSSRFFFFKLLYFPFFDPCLRTSVLRCGRISDLFTCFWRYILVEINSYKVFLIHMYSSFDDMCCARMLFNEMSERNVGVWRYTNLGDFILCCSFNLCSFEFVLKWMKVVI